MNMTKTLRVAAMAMLAFGLMACSACSLQGGSNEAAPATRSDDAAAQPNAGGEPAAGEVTSTAMVAYANGDELLFVDQETQTPYIPTNIDDAAIIYNGQEVDEDDLVAGNIVQVTGNGIMLESYPGQYPGITKVEVVEQGSPADAEQYADIVDTVFAAPDQSQVPVGNLDYKTTDAQVSVMLNPYSYEWAFDQPDGTPDRVAQDGDILNADGTVLDGAPDARISGAVDAFAAFSVNPTSVEIERIPLAAGSTADAAKVDPTADDTNVPCTLGEDGAAAFTIEPGDLYRIDATFPQGEADYAFFTVS
ncbi:hypothetical protein [uncultured Adlercreutzia sp.]|uniref:hypothetical protein n=1 Tax=uncultured Adlercreutzia sp. TaxID=875803 RepID=UPI002676FB13|nr:hypothetical protein [uncultured Adlercreutzia sp.]